MKYTITQEDLQAMRSNLLQPADNPGLTIHGYVFQRIIGEVAVDGPAGFQFGIDTSEDSIDVACDMIASQFTVGLAKLKIPNTVVDFIVVLAHQLMHLQVENDRQAFGFTITIFPSVGELYLHISANDKTQDLIRIQKESAIKVAH